MGPSGGLRPPLQYQKVQYRSPEVKIRRVPKWSQNSPKIVFKVAQISNFSKFKVQGLDIATLLGAKGLQQGAQGPRVPKGSQPSAGARRKVV